MTLGFLGFLLGIIFFNPVLAADVTAMSPATQFVMYYKNEAIAVICFISLILSTWLSVVLPTDESKTELSKTAKIIASVLGGFLAFVYSIHTDKQLTLLNPFWITVSCITLPVTIITLRNKFSRYAETINLDKEGE